jgi:hypothetical protein
MQRTLRDLGRNRHRRSRAAIQFGARRKQILGLVGEFRLRCQKGAAVELLAETLDDVIKTASESIERGSPLSGGKSIANADMARCLFDLEQLRSELRTRHRPPANELEHAMDALIVQLICAESERERGGSWFRPCFINTRPACVQ